MKELQILREVGIFIGLQGWEEFLDMLARTINHFPDVGNDIHQKIKVTVFLRYCPLPISLVYIRGMIVIKEVILTHGFHVGADPLSDIAAELF